MNSVPTNMIFKWVSRLALLLFAIIPSSHADAQVTLNVSQGWNLVGNSSAASIDVATTFGDASRIIAVWKWNKTSAKWALYSPSVSPAELALYAGTKGFEVLSSIGAKEGFWINAASSAAFTGPAASGLPLAEGDFQSGWNLLSSADNKTPAQLNSSLGGSLQSSGKAVVTVWAWDSPSVKWRFYSPSLDALGGNALGNYIAANGYLPFETVLSASDGFWVNIVATAVASVLSLDLKNLFNYAAPVLPAYYDTAVVALDNSPASAPVGEPLNKAATLGRVLFFDKKLSLNDTVACASCHLPAQGFSDPNQFSTGFSGTAFTSAHSMRLANARYFRPGSMFWDRRAASLEAQVVQPLQNSIEMGFDAANGGMAALLAKMRGLSYYPELFKFAFGSDTITEAGVQTALSAFVRSMVSTNSRWDTAYAQVYNAALPDKGLSLSLPGFSTQEDRGRQLFMNGPQQGGLGCAGCHVPPTFALAANSLSNGLDAGETTVFKSPALKNIGLAGRFMHDGRFSTLEQVVEHYNSGVKAGPALDNRLKAPNGTPRALNLSASDKAALAAFLRTLDDSVILVNPQFSNPFR